MEFPYPEEEDIFTNKSLLVSIEQNFRNFGNSSLTCESARYFKSPKIYFLLFFFLYFQSTHGLLLCSPNIRRFCSLRIPISLFFGFLEPHKRRSCYCACGWSCIFCSRMKICFLLFETIKGIFF